MEKEWVKVYSTTQVHKAQIVKAVLADSVIVVSELNKMDSNYAFVPLGEIELYVNQNDVVRATHLITKNEL